MGEATATAPTSSSSSPVPSLAEELAQLGISALGAAKDAPSPAAGDLLSFDAAAAKPEPEPVAQPSPPPTRVRVFFDLDRQGDAPRPHAILSLGAVAVRDSDGAELAEFQRNLKPMPGQGMSERARSFWEARPLLLLGATADAVPPAGALSEFFAWCRAQGASSLHAARLLDLVFLAACAAEHAPPEDAAWLARAWDDSLCVSRRTGGDDDAEAARLVQLYTEDPTSRDCCVDDARAYARAFVSSLV